MEITSLHLLLTYQCTLECDHCFVWGSPRQSGTMTLEQISDILEQARRLGTVTSIYFEGGEPFLYYGVLKSAVEEAVHLGMQVGIVSNAYWATGMPDAIAWLKPFAGLVADLSVSSDVYHWNERFSRQAAHASAAARQLGIPLDTLAVAQPETLDAACTVGQLPAGESSVMYRGRAAEKLASRATLHLWQGFNICGHEDLREPGRVHVDPFGNLHLCQGIIFGNLFDTPLREIARTYDPALHPIAGPLLEGGPAELARRYGITPALGYADACHLCYQTRLALRSRMPDILGPDQMYGVMNGN